MKLRDIPKFETNNSLKITVSSLDADGSLFCCHRSKLKGNFRKVFSLLLTDGLNSHYCLKTNFQNLMHKLCRSLRKPEERSRTNFWVNCLQWIKKTNMLIISGCVKTINLREPWCLVRSSNWNLSIGRKPKSVLCCIRRFGGSQCCSKSCQREKYCYPWTSSPS